MAKRLVAADASPLIGLATAGAFGLLRDLFGLVTVTHIVCDEVMAGKGRSGEAELSVAINAGWFDVVHVDPDVVAFPDLDDGESSTLVAARDHTGPRLVIMDERLGRSHADELGLSVVGVAGILIDARKQGLVKAVEPLLGRLERADSDSHPTLSGLCCNGLARTPMEAAADTGFPLGPA